MMGGIATAKENSQINCTYLDVRQVTCVVTCHDRSCHMTDVNRIAAIAVRVYRELIPKMYMRIRKVMGMPKVDFRYCNIFCICIILKIQANTENCMNKCYRWAKKSIQGFSFCKCAHRINWYTDEYDGKITDNQVHQDKMQLCLSCLE